MRFDQEGTTQNMRPGTTNSDVKMSDMRTVELVQVSGPDLNRDNGSLSVNTRPGGLEDGKRNRLSDGAVEVKAFNYCDEV
jgi:hypothetical protein